MSTNTSNYAVIFKAVSDTENEEKDLYYETFTAAGFQVTMIPVLEFEFVNLDLFLDKIKRPEDYAGLIFTSPRCVTGFELAIEAGKDKSLSHRWKNHTHFVVGEKTGRMAESFGFTVFGKETGNGEKMAEIICKDKYNKPFLYPVGSLSQQNFKMKLKNHEIEVDDVLIYKTKPHSTLESNIKKVKELCNKLIYFIYFSPSGVKFTLPILKKFNIDLKQIKFVAIGPTTESELIENGLQVAGTACKPNPASLLSAVLS